jgi:hypothetical protein
MLTEMPVLIPLTIGTENHARMRISSRFDH